ncbi:uncharacterized protein LOC142226100 [Haematobia irritans]|uniref:uncharacterized protein LOC142226100 n=1 Tax=Haematobia irritans TaxID=7368 RepID=UPI003F50A26C
MLKSTNAAELSKPFKCGEIFCISQPDVFQVSCFLCNEEVDFYQFVDHFQNFHSTLAEDIVSVVGINDIIKEDPEYDDLKQEHFEDAVCDQIDEEDVIPEWTYESTGSNNNLKDGRDEDVCDDYSTGMESATVSTQIEIVRDAQDDLSSSQIEMEILEQLHDDLNGMSSNNANKEANVKPSASDDDDDWGDNLEQGESTQKDLDNNVFDPNRYYCHICERTYCSEGSLKKHRYKYHKNENSRKINYTYKFKCDQCDEAFRNSRDLRGHMYKHTGIICDICDKSFTQLAALKAHKIRHTGVKDYKCKECGKEFFNKISLNEHVKGHVLPVVCEVCGKRFRNSTLLRDHMLRHRGEKPFKCDICEKRFFAKHNLKLHMVSHSDDRPFPCDLCGVKFKSKKTMKMHRVTHSKNCRYACKLCDRAFHQSNSLTSHMRTHKAVDDTNDTPNPWSTYHSKESMHIGTDTQYTNIERIVYVRELDDNKDSE